MEFASLFSITPSLVLDFFLSGKFYVKKSTSSWGACPEIDWLIMDRAF
jgi:hypothetical protein